MKQYRSQIQGFTLVELAIVLIILGLMISMFLGPLAAQREIRSRAETIVLLEQAKEALMGYTIVNRHMPCPDDDSPPDGVENRTGSTCDSDHGVYPWVTIGVRGLDAWSRYFTYRVDATFSNSTTLFTIDDAENNSIIDVKTSSTGTNLTSNTSRPAAVLFSHGENGSGAWSNQGVQFALPIGVDELENTNGNLIYVSRSPTPEGSANAYDDMLIWISPKVLINRMITAGRLP